MKLFTINTHNAYLNSTVTFSNLVEDVITIVDTTSNTSFSVDSNISIHLPAGEHCFTAEFNGSKQMENVYINDAIKLGGSEIKKGYVFDESPWEMIVMNDRTYFFNRETNFESVEHRISPNDIKYLAEGFFLFITGIDYAIFSVKKMTYTIRCNDLLYYNSRTLIYRKDHKIIAYDYINDNIIIEHFEKYSIDNIKGILYLHSPKTEEIKSLNLNNCNFNKKISKIKRGTFRMHGKYALYVNGASKDVNYYILDNLETGISIFFNLPYFISSLEDNILIDINYLKEQFDDLLKNNYELCNLFSFSLNYYIVNDIIRIGDKVLFLMDYVTVNHYKNTKSEHHDYILMDINTRDTVTILNKNYKFLYYSDNENVVLGLPKDKSNNQDIYDLCIIDTAWNKKEYFNTVAIRNTKNELFFATKENNIYTILNSNGNKLISGEFEINTEKYSGVICGMVNGLHCIVVLRDNEVFVSEKTSEDILKYSAGIPMWKINNKTYKLLGVSYSGKNSIIECDNWIYNRTNGDNQQILTKIFDNRKFANAFFSTDEQSLFIEENENVMQTYNFEDLCEDKFKIENYVSIDSAGINGNKPLFDIDSNRRPVWRDPITLGMIMPDELSKYVFMSSNRDFSAKNNLTSTIFNVLTDSNITDEEHKQLIDIYDFKQNSSDNDKKSIIMARKELIDKFILNVGTLEKRSDFTQLFIEKRGYCNYKNLKTGKEGSVLIGRDVEYLNYVSFSYDSRYLALGAKLSSNGIFKLYDLHNGNHIVVDNPEYLSAVWMAAFNRKGDIAYYDSTPNTYIIKNLQIKDTETIIISNIIRGKSLLCFSPSGKYIALSDQGYIPFDMNTENWGHQPSCNIYLYDMNNLQELFVFNDSGAGIIGIDEAKSVTSVAFSSDERRLLSVTNDGVIVVRNLHK